MILEIRGMMKSRGHFTYPSKICGANGVVPKGYYKYMMNLIELVVLRTPTYCRKQIVSLNTTKDEYIAAKKKASKRFLKVMRHMIQKNYTDEDEDYTLIHFIIG